MKFVIFSRIQVYTWRALHYTSHKTFHIFPYLSISFHDLLQDLQSLHPTCRSTQRAWLVALRTLPQRAWEAHGGGLWLWQGPKGSTRSKKDLEISFKKSTSPALPPLPPPIFSAGLAAGGFMVSTCEIKVKQSSGTPSYIPHVPNLLDTPWHTWSNHPMVPCTVAGPEHLGESCHSTKISQ